jgi:hypothetical protein
MWLMTDGLSGVIRTLDSESSRRIGRESRQAITSLIAGPLKPGGSSMPRGKAKHHPANPDAPLSANSQMDAVRQALGVLGYDAKPPALDGFIRDKFGMSIKPNMISSYKSQLKAKRKKGRGRPPGPAANGATKEVGGNVNLKDLQELKTLAGRLGVEKLRKLVDYLA